jgi:hypothetical protein
MRKAAHLSRGGDRVKGLTVNVGQPENIAGRQASDNALSQFVTDHYPAALPLNRFTACVILKRRNCTPKTSKKD